MRVKKEEIEDFISAGIAGSKKQVGENLVLRISNSGRATYSARYTDQSGKRREKTLGAYKEINLSTARAKALKLKDEKPENHHKKTTVKYVFDLLMEDKRAEVLEGSLGQKNYDTYVRNSQHLKPIMSLSIDTVLPLDVLSCIKKVKDRPSVSNNVLSLSKQIFALAYKLNMITMVPTFNLTRSDAGGPDNRGDRVLSVEEIEVLFSYLRLYASRKVYLACILLIIFGSRKSDILQAKAVEFDFDECIWMPPKKEPNKKLKKVIKGRPEKVPLEPEIIDVIKESLVLSKNSDYILNVTRQPFNRPMGETTINSTLYRIFRKTDIPIKPIRVHDLRRTSATLVGKILDGESVVLDKHLGHAGEKVRSIYLHEDFLDKRREVQRKLLDLIGGYILD